MAKLLDLSVYGPGHISNILQVDASVYAMAFITDGGKNTQVVRGDGTLASISSLSVGNADTLDNKHASDFALLKSWNDLIHSTNEFTFVSPGYTGAVWLNYRTSSGNTDGSINQYTFGDGKGGELAYISKGYFSGNAATATSSTSSNYSRNLLGRNTSGGDYDAVDGNLIFAEWNTYSDNRWYLKAKGYKTRVGYANDSDKLDGYHAGFNNNQVSIYTPFPTWSTLKSKGFINANYGNSDYGHPDEEFLKGICKWAIYTYPNQGDITLMGTIVPNSSGTCILHMYSDSGKDSTTLLPRYCRGQYLNLSGYLYHFGTVNYVWSLNRFAFASEIKNPTNYYWANQLITDSAKSDATPTFGSVVSTGLITAKSGVQIGSTSDIGWYFYNSRICAGISVARGVNAGSLLVSSAWTDDSKVPTNGIYSKGNIITPANLQALNLNLYGDWETDFGINFNEGGDTKYGFSLLYGDSDLFKLITRNEGTASTVLSVGRGSTQVDFKGKVTVAGRLYPYEWIQFNNNTGLYWPNHPNTGIEMHIRPNTFSSYGGFAMYGKRGTYSGILLGTSNANLCLMDDGNNSGLYVESIGKWVIYNLRSSNQIGIGTSSCTSNYGITLGGSTHLKGNLLINGESHCYTLTTSNSSNWVYLTKLLKGSTTSDKSYEAGIGWHNTGGDGSGALTLVPHAQNTSPWAGTVGLYISASNLAFNGTPVSLNGHTHDDRYVNVTGDTMTGGLTFSTDSAITWSRNTDYASIRFQNTGDGDTNSYLDLQTGDNGNEYIRLSRNAGGTVYEMASFKSEGAYITGALSTTGPVVSNTYHQVYNSGSYTRAAANITGAIVIQLPITSSQYDMINVEIAVYEYNSQAASKIIVGGHPWQGAWYNHSCSIIGNYTRGVRLGIYGSAWSIILGTSSTVWQYPGVFVIHIGTVYDTYSSAYANKCSCSLVTSESGFSALVNPTNVVKATHALDAGNNTPITFHYSTGGFSSNPSWVAAWNGYDLTYVSPSVLNVNYASSSGNADTVDGQHFSYSNSSNSPTYLWATNSNGSSFLAARGSISVNYANSAGNADTVDNKHASDFMPASGGYISGTTVADVKTNLLNYFKNKPATTNAYTSATFVTNFGNDSYTIQRSSVCGWIALNPGYDNYNHGHFLVSEYGNNRLRHVGLGYNTWYGPYTIAYTSDIPTVTNYYWANVNVSASSSTSTYPTFGSLSVISDSCNNSTDALAYFRHYSTNDWGVIIDKGGYDWGIDVRSFGPNAAKIAGTLTLGQKVTERKYTWLKLATPGHTGSSGWCVGIDDTSDNSYLYFKYTESDSLKCYIRHDGVMYASAFYESSDIRLKQNIKQMYTSSNIPQIKEFDWKESGKHSYGLIAQELESMGYSELVDIKDDGYKSVNYTAAHSLIIGKLQLKIKELEDRIKYLESK